jgi:hypothetical protein
MSSYGDYLPCVPRQLPQINYANEIKNLWAMVLTRPFPVREEVQENGASTRLTGNEMSLMCCQSTNITAEKCEGRPSLKDPRAFALLAKVEAFQIWRRVGSWSLEDILDGRAAA